MYHGSICQVLAITTQASAVPVCPSQGIPASSTPKMCIRDSMEAKQRGLQFNDKETNLIVSILTSGMAPEEKKKLDILKMLSKKMAGPR